MTHFLETCFGLRLRTGVLIIGYLHLIPSSIVFIMHAITIVSYVITHSEADHNTEGFLHDHRDHYINVFSFIQMSILTYMFTVLFLVYGATKGNRHYMLPFVSLISILSVDVIFFELLCCLFLVSQMLRVVIMFLCVGINVFSIYVILSHHQELKKLTLVNQVQDDEASILNSA